MTIISSYTLNAETNLSLKHYDCYLTDNNKIIDDFKLKKVLTGKKMTQLEVSNLSMFKVRLEMLQNISQTVLHEVIRV